MKRTILSSHTRRTRWYYSQGKFTDYQMFTTQNTAINGQVALRTSGKIKIECCFPFKRHQWVGDVTYILICVVNTRTKFWTLNIRTYRIGIIGECSWNLVWVFTIFVFFSSRFFQNREIAVIQDVWCFMHHTETRITIKSHFTAMTGDRRWETGDSRREEIGLISTVCCVKDFDVVLEYHIVALK